MIPNMKTQNCQYVVDKKGRKTAVILDIEDYEVMLEQISDLRVIAERKKNQKIQASNFVIKLKKNGIL